MTPRGFTLLEVTLSLALLGTIAVACVGLTSVTLRASAAAATGAGWERAAHRVLDAIEDDLRVVDKRRARRAQDASGLRTHDDGLDVPTRIVSRGRDGAPARVAVTRRYMVDEHGMLWMHDLDANGEWISSRPLLDGVRSIAAHAGEPAAGSLSRESVRVVLEGINGRSVARTHTTPAGDAG